MWGCWRFPWRRQWWGTHDPLRTLSQHPLCGVCVHQAGAGCHSLSPLLLMAHCWWWRSPHIPLHPPLLLTLLHDWSIDLLTGCLSVCVMQRAPPLRDVSLAPVAASAGWWRHFPPALAGTGNWERRRGSWDYRQRWHRRRGCLGRQGARREAGEGSSPRTEVGSEAGRLTGRRRETPRRRSCPGWDVWEAPWSLKREKERWMNEMERLQTTLERWCEISETGIGIWNMNQGFASFLPKSARRDCRPKCMVRLLACFPVFNTTSSWPTSHRSNPERVESLHHHKLQV